MDVRIKTISAVKKILFAFLSLVIVTGCGGPHRAAVIFDTDMAPDYDDVGALAMLHALADSGEAEILATVTSNRFEYSVPCIEVINAYFGRPDLPTGGPKGVAPLIDTWHKEKWTSLLPAKYAHRTAGASDAEDAVEVYRRVLSMQPDSSVTVVTVGFFSNLRDLLLSSPDEFSPLTGRELVARKVERLVSMAALFPRGLEFNIMQDAEAARVVCEQWPTPILFSGAEIGSAVFTGKAVVDSPVGDSPVKEAYVLCMEQDSCENHASFDQTAVLTAVRGTRNYFAEERGRLRVLEDSSTEWTPDADGPHARLLWKMKPEELAGIIDALMAHRPGGR